MPLTDLVPPNAIVPGLRANNKKQVLQELAAKAAELTGQNERAVVEILLQRERLGSTAVGNGVAIPHGKLPSLNRLFGLFARLERPIDFEALDGRAVDLVFLLLAPEGAEKGSIMTEIFIKGTEPTEYAPLDTEITEGNLSENEYTD